MNLKDRLKKNKILYKISKKWIEKINDYQAKRNFKFERKINHHLENGKINVGFVITQGLSNWGKTEPIFFALKNDGRFQLTIICIPEWKKSIK